MDPSDDDGRSWTPELRTLCPPRRIRHTPDVTAEASTRHQCMIYDGAPSRMLPDLVATIRRNLEGRMRCLYLNSPHMVAGVGSLLYAAGTDVQHEVARGALVLASRHDHLVDGLFVVDRLIQSLEAAVEKALADGYAGLFATGDMTWELGPQPDFSALVEYEWQLEQLFRRQPALSGICQYHRDVLPQQAVRDGVVSHGAVFINATLTRLNPHYARERAVQERRSAANLELDGLLTSLLA